jgi:hypothetical protein
MPPIEPPLGPMPPRGPVDMLLGRNCACDPVVAAATTITAKAVEIDSNPIVLKRLFKPPIAISPRKKCACSKT